MRVIDYATLRDAPQCTRMVEAFFRGEDGLVLERLLRPAYPECHVWVSRHTRWASVTTLDQRCSERLHGDHAEVGFETLVVEPFGASGAAQFEVAVRFVGLPIPRPGGPNDKSTAASVASEWTTNAARLPHL